MEVSGIGSLILLIADIYAILMILQSSSTTVQKLIWALVVFLLPLLGLIIWFFAGPGKKRYRLAYLRIVGSEIYTLSRKE